MRSFRQLVATYGNSFDLLSPFPPSVDLPLIATGRNQRDPVRLQKLLICSELRAASASSPARAVS
jgi:hypothetical protein